MLQISVPKELRDLLTSVFMQFELDKVRVNRIFSARNTDFGDFLRNGMEFYYDNPEVEQIIWACQNRVGLEKKRQRVWEAQQCGLGSYGWYEGGGFP